MSEQTAQSVGNGQAEVSKEAAAKKAAVARTAPKWETDARERVRTAIRR